MSKYRPLAEFLAQRSTAIVRLHYDGSATVLCSMVEVGQAITSSLEPQAVLELIGDDVAAFCDDLVKDSRTYADIYQESVSEKRGRAKK